jgi:hypothetical protein
MKRIRDFAILVVLLAGCTLREGGSQNSLSAKETLLLGKWTGEAETGHWVIVRRPDHTFSKDETITYEFGEPAARFQSSGTWKVNGNSYSETCTAVSNSRFKTWLGESSYGILHRISPADFEYKGDDAPIIIEKRIE